jgi:ribose transport system ATP-binding protein
MEVKDKIAQPTDASNKNQKTTAPLLKMSNINISFSGTQVLFDASFELKAGEINCLLGENGAGKSTLVKILSGVNTQYTGNIEIEGREVKITSPIVSKQLGIHSIQQHRDLVPTLNAVENIFLGEMYVKGAFLDKEKMRSKARDLLSQFGTNIDLDVPVRDLKVSEQGIIAICKAISSECKILLVDEASAPLDNSERAILYNILRKLKEQGKGIVYITHHLEEVHVIGDAVTVLRGGRTVAVMESNKTDIPMLVSAMTGQKKLYNRDNVIERNIDPDETPVLEVNGLTNKYLNNVSFKAYKGEIIGFAGLEGCGKQLIAETIYGLVPYSKGEIKIWGEVKHFNLHSAAVAGGTNSDEKMVRDFHQNVILVLSGR